MTTKQIVLNREQIESYIPHRKPFLFLDSVIEFESSKKIVCEYLVSGEEEFFKGHFPSNPILPGVIMLEAIAQAGGVLCSKSYSEDFSNFILSGLKEAKFKRIISPGETMKIQCYLEKSRKSFYWLKGDISVNGELCTSVSFTAHMD